VRYLLVFSRDGEARLAQLLLAYCAAFDAEEHWRMVRTKISLAERNKVMSITLVRTSVGKYCISTYCMLNVQYGML
jgi:hypothetical protein